MKCIAEGMKDWMEVKVAVGNKDLVEAKGKIGKEILSYSKDIAPELFSVKIIEKMKALGVEKNNLKEFKGVFLTNLKN